MPNQNFYGLEDALIDIRESGIVDPDLIRGKTILSQNGTVYIADEIVYTRSDHSSFIIKANDLLGAVHCLKCTFLTDHQIQKGLAAQECDALGRLEGVPNVIQMKENFRTENTIWIVTEFYPMTLSKLERSSLTEAQIWFFLWKLLVIVKTIHSHDIIHRDIKPENILLDDKGDVILCDFGSVKLRLPHFPDPASGIVVGTPSYSAPEFSTLDYSPKGDTYSIGKVILYLLQDTQEKNSLKNFVGSRLCGEKTRPPPSEILKDPVLNPLRNKIVPSSLFASMSVERESKKLLDSQTRQAHVLAVALSKIKSQSQENFLCTTSTPTKSATPLWIMENFRSAHISDRESSVLLSVMRRNQQQAPSKKGFTEALNCPVDFCLLSDLRTCEDFVTSSPEIGDAISMLPVEGHLTLKEFSDLLNKVPNMKPRFIHLLFCAAPKNDDFLVENLGLLNWLSASPFHIVDNLNQLIQESGARKDIKLRVNFMPEFNSKESRIISNRLRSRLWNYVDLVASVYIGSKSCCYRKEVIENLVNYSKEFDSEQLRFFQDSLLTLIKIWLEECIQCLESFQVTFEMDPLREGDPNNPLWQKIYQFLPYAQTFMPPTANKKNLNIKTKPRLRWRNSEASTISSSSPSPNVSTPASTPSTSTVSTPSTPCSPRSTNTTPTESGRFEDDIQEFFSSIQDSPTEFPKLDFYVNLAKYISNGVRLAQGNHLVPKLHADENEFRKANLFFCVSKCFKINESYGDPSQQFLDTFKCLGEKIQDQADETLYRVSKEISRDRFRFFTMETEEVQQEVVSLGLL